MKAVKLADTSKSVIYDPPKIGWVRDCDEDVWEEAIVLGIDSNSISYKILTSCLSPKEYKDEKLSKKELFFSDRRKYKMLVYENPYGIKKWRWSIEWWKASYVEQCDNLPTWMWWQKERDYYIPKENKCKCCETVHRFDCQPSSGLAEYNMTYCETYKEELEQEGYRVNENC